MLDQLVNICPRAPACDHSPLERIDRPRQVAQQPRGVDLEMPEDPGQVAVGSLGQLDQPVLDLDAVIGARRHSPAAACKALRQVGFSVLIKALESTPMMKSSPR